MLLDEMYELLNEKRSDYDKQEMEYHSNFANRASKLAHTNKTRDDHEFAADAHRKAAKMAKGQGLHKKSAKHDALAQAHDDLAKKNR